MAKRDISDEEILRLWQDPSFPAAYRGVRSVQLYLKTEYDLDVSANRLYQILSKNPVFITHQRRYKKIQHRSYYLRFFGELCQADIGYLFSWNDYKYFLLFIDCYSNQIFTKALKTKDSQEVSKALKEIFAKIKTQVHIFETDRY